MMVATTSEVGSPGIIPGIILVELNLNMADLTKILQLNHYNYMADNGISMKQLVNMYYIFTSCFMDSMGDTKGFATNKMKMSMWWNHIDINHQ